MKPAPAQILRLPRVKPVPRWRRWMAMSIPLPHVLGYTGMILGTIVVVWASGYYHGHQGVNGPELEAWIKGAQAYRYVGRSVVENCILDRRQRAQLHSGGRIENVLERRR